MTACTLIQGILTVLQILTAISTLISFARGLRDRNGRLPPSPPHMLPA